MDISPDAVAEEVLKTFDSLEQKRKPLKRSSDTKEWVPLSGIVVQGVDSLRCVALATGMKCLPQNKISQAQGVVLHDWHAEILAIRTFNRFLLEECYALALKEKPTSEYVHRRHPDERTESHFQPFALNDGINLHMYCSEAPCGDASMELTIASQADSTPWTIPTPPTNLSPSSSPTNSHQRPLILHGRSYFSSLGLVRRKPSRTDAPPTLSKSCSDKLACKQSLSLLSSLTSLLISPLNVYISTLTLPSTQLSQSGIQRAFAPTGRLAGLVGKDKDWEGGYKYHPFKVLGTEREFGYSRRQHLNAGEKLMPSNNSAVWTPRFSETLIGGSIQGRKVFSLKGASRVCKRRSWRLVAEIVRVVGGDLLEGERYGLVKGCERLEGRRRVKRDVRGVLGGWVRNEGGEEFGLEGVDL